eukprot:3109962-Pleurochrysis_carterae.AAC.1
MAGVRLGPTTIIRKGSQTAQVRVASTSGKLSRSRSLPQRLFSIIRSHARLVYDTDRKLPIISKY